jgi:hypothetical protein
VKLILMNVHPNLVTMVQVVWTYLRDIGASVLLVSCTKIIISLNFSFQVTKVCTSWLVVTGKYFRVLYIII